MAYEVLKGAIAASGDKQDIPAVQDGTIANRMSFALGFPQITSEDKNLGGLPPRRADINQAFYLLSNNLYEFQNGAFPTFNTSALAYLPGGVGYPLNAILWCAAEGRFVRSMKANNADNFITTPTYIGTSWKFLNSLEVSDDAVGLLLANSPTNITVGTGFVKSVTTGRILRLDNSLSVLWTTIQTNSSVTGAANTRYNLFLAYNPTNTTYTILCAAYGSCTPTLPTGYTDYALIGYMSTDNNNAVNNVFPQEMDLQQWYRSGQVNNDKLTRFCVNSGNLTNGNGDLISVSGSVVTFKVGGTYPNIVCTPANQLASFSLSTLNNFNTSTLANGTYVLCVSKNGVVSAHAYVPGTLTYVSNKGPESPVSGQVWLNTGKEPLEAYQYNSGWIPFNEVPLCVVFVNNGSVTGNYTLPYNRGIGNLVSYVIDSYRNGSEWYRVWSDGWCEQGGFVNRAQTDTVNLHIPMSDNEYSIFMFARAGHRYAFQNQASTSTYFRFNSADDESDNNDGTFYWEVKGYIKADANTSYGQSATCTVTPSRNPASDEMVWAYFDGTQFYASENFSYDASAIANSFNSQYGGNGYLATVSSNSITITSPQATGGDCNGKVFSIEYHRGFVGDATATFSGTLSGGQNA